MIKEIMFTAEKVDKSLFHTYIGERNALWMLLDIKDNPHKFLDQWNELVDMQNSKEESEDE